MTARTSFPRLAAIAALLALCAPAFAAKSDARLRIARARAAGATGVAGAGTPASVFRAFLRVTPGTTLAELRAAYPSSSFGSMSGPVVTVAAPGADLDAFETDARIVSVQGERKLRKNMDVVRSNSTTSGLYLGTTRNSAATDLASVTGAGVVVGVVDTGIDFRHADFITSGGASRIKYLWDQTDAGGPSPSGISCTTDCGTEWTNAQLNASIPSGGSVRETDTDGHGTHVAGIAAGNGRATGNSFAAGTFTGMAPAADLVVVKTDYSDVGILDAINYIVARAASLGERAVINLSLGSNLDPHDGTSSFDVGIAAVAASTPVVVAMGNDGGNSPHAQMNSLAFNQSVTFSVSESGGPTDARVDLWGSSSDAYTVTVALTGLSCGTMSKASGASTGSSPFTCGSNSVYIDNASAGTGSTSASDREMFVDVYDASGLAITGLTVTVTCTAAAGCGRLDAFVEPGADGTAFVSGFGYSVPTTLTMGAPATANNVIAVASYASKISWTDLAGQSVHYTDGQTAGALSLFSGTGPTRDGRQKPDVAAPGEGIGASLSASATISNNNTFNSLQLLGDGVHAILQGTSMATPVVTGILAGRLQGYPSRTVAQLRSILQGLARTDANVTGYGAVPNSFYGYGKVVSSPQPASPPNTLVATALGASSVTWSWSTALVGADSYDVYYATNAASPLASAIQPPFVQTGLLGNATYGLLIRGVGGGIEGPGSSISTATYAAAPSAAPSATGWTSSATVSFPGLACPAFPAANSCSGYVVQASLVSDFSSSVFSSATTNRLLTTLSITGLTASTGYFVRLGTLNPFGAPSFGPYATFNTGTSLLPPTTPVFDLISSSTIRFNWAQGSNPGGLTYVAQVSTASNYTGTLTSQSGTALNSAFSGLAADTSWYFRVQAVGGPFLTAGPTATLATTPAVSTNSFPAVGATGLTTAWAPNGNQSDSLYQADASPAADFSTGLVSVQSRTPAAAFTGLTPNTAYYTRVAAISRSGSVTSAIPLGSTTTLVQTPTVGGSPFSAQATDGFAFAFGANGNPAGTRFLVQVSTDPAFTVVSAAATTVATSASFTGLKSNQAYFVRVAGLNQAGVPSPFVGASTATAVAAPSAAPVAVTTRTATVFGFAWSSGTLATGTVFAADLSSSPAFAFSVASSATANAFASYAGLQPNTTYYGRVGANSQNPPTPNGPVVVVATGTTLPNLPGAVAVPFAGVFFTSATVAWSPLPPAPSSAAAEGYRVEFSTDPAFGGVWASSVVAPGASSATVSGLSYATVFYARVGSLSWDGGANYRVLGSTTTPLPPLSSGTVTGAGLSLNIPPAFPQISAIRVDVPGLAFPSGTLVTAVADIPMNLNAAKSNEANGLVPFGPTVGIDLSAGGAQPSSPIRIAMAYDPTQIPVGQTESHLHLWRYDPASAQWTLVPSQADTRAHVLNASVQHFSIFAPFFVAPGSDLSAVQAFPQPWEITAPSSAYWASALTFSGMPSGARVRLFTLTGELVFDGTASGGGILTWDGMTRFGKRAASGTYFAAFEAGGQRAVRRVVIIR